MTVSDIGSRLREIAEGHHTEHDKIYLMLRAAEAHDKRHAASAHTPVLGWLTMDSAPRDRFILLWCAEDNSRWLAMWQGDRWYGVDDEGLTREGASIGDLEVVTGWYVDRWQSLPAAPLPQEEKQ